MLVSIPDVPLPAAGYHTIPVTSQVELGAFDEIAVVAHIRNQKSIFPLAVDHISTPVAGKSWFSADGVNWISLDTNTFSPNAGLRLRTSLPLPPPQPAGFNITSASQSTLRLNWLPLNTLIRGFLLERQNPITFVWERIADLNPATTTFLNTGLAPDKIYRYRLFAYNLGGLSIPAETQGRTLPNPPEAPLELNPIILSPASVRLEWSDQSNNETGFRVERQRIGEDWIKLAEVGSNTPSFLDNTVLVGALYRYRVIAYNEGGDSLALVSDIVLIPDWPFWVCLPIILN